MMEDGVFLPGLRLRAAQMIVAGVGIRVGVGGVGRRWGIAQVRIVRRGFHHYEVVVVIVVGS